VWISYLPSAKTTGNSSQSVEETTKTGHRRPGLQNRNWTTRETRQPEGTDSSVSWILEIWWQAEKSDFPQSLAVKNWAVRCYWWLDSGCPIACRSIFHQLSAKTQQISIHFLLIVFFYIKKIKDNFKIIHGSSSKTGLSCNMTVLDQGSWCTAGFYLARPCVKSFDVNSCAHCPCHYILSQLAVIQRDEPEWSQPRRFHCSHIWIRCGNVCKHFSFLSYLYLFLVEHSSNTLST
jgi:hypothetical protein